MPDSDRSTSRPLDEADLSGFERLSQPSRAALDAAPSTSFILSEERSLRAPVPAGPAEPPRPVRPVERAQTAAPVAAERRRETARRAPRSAPAQAAKPAPAPSPRRREALGILLLSSGLFVVLSLLSLVLGDGTLMGPVGRWVAGAIYSVLGAGTLALGGGLLLIAVRCLRAQPLKVPRLMLLGVLGGCLAIAVLLHLVGAPLRLHGMPLGGVVGEYTAELGVAMLGTAGTLLVAVAMLLLCVLAATPLSVHRGAVAVSQLVRRALLPLGRWLQALARSLRARLVALRTREPVAATPTPASSVSPAAAAVPAVRDGVPVIIRDYGDDRDARDPTALPAARRAKDLARDAAKDKEAPAAAKPASSGPPPVIVERRPAARPEEPAAAAAVEPVVVPVAVAVTVTAAAAPRSPFGDAPTEASGAVGRTEDVTERTAVAPGGDGPDQAEAVPGVVSDGATNATPDATTDATAADGPVVVPPPPPKGAHEIDAAVAPTAKRADDKPHGHYVPLKPAYEPPPLSMFDFEEPPHREFDRRAMLDLAQRLESTLADYLVKGRVAAIHPGPVVTMYEFVPAPGIKLSKITALSSDLAMALEALRVRIVAPIPGKAAVGIEVPNRSRETVFLKEILADEGFRVAKSKLTMALGKDISGAPVNVDLAKMPHLLVAGTTGSGKSVSVNAMVCSLLVNASPDEVKMIMIDPKMLELSIYEGIPHLLLPVVTEPKKANLALKWAVDEMERRYDLISKAGVRDIFGYNKKIEKQLEIIEAEQQELFGDDDYEVAEKPLKLPYIVVLIDEFADLMMVASKEVETSVARIAQKARAAGIHLILATQRPSVDVITGLIKANFPSRIAFQVASRIDSRTILDQQGAENLLGMGDMLFTDRGQALRRVHGALITDSEIHRVVEHLKQQGKPIYDMDILKPREEEGEEPVEEDMSDELYDQAVRIVAETRQASISMVQRRLRIGYNRAARMIERMEREGIVGPADGVKGREVLITNL
jgi:S-DNA-T family DNA segregation ATPase FtsK/SpoIIIE